MGGHLDERPCWRAAAAVPTRTAIAQVSRQADIPCAQARLDGVGYALEGFIRFARTNSMQLSSLAHLPALG